MTNNKHTLYDDMTLVGLVLMHAGQILTLVLNQGITSEEFSDREDEILQLCKMNATHPSETAILSPFIEDFLPAVKQWMGHKNNPDSLTHFAKVLQGDELHTKEIEISAAKIANSSAAPLWYRQVLEFGELFLREYPGIQETIKEKYGDKIGALMRNVPADTVLGLMAQEFLNEATYKSPDIKKLKRVWSILKGEVPLRYTLKVKGLFAWTEA